MFPIRDHNPSQKTPYVTVALILANVVVFLGTLPLLYGTPAEMQRFFFDWAMIPARISSGDGIYTVVTSLFLHGGFLHIAGNMLFLWVFGDNLEDEMGHVGFLLFYMACGIGADLTHVAFAPNSYVPTVGASGAIAGVMGGYLLLFPKARVDILFIFIVFFKVFPVPSWLMLGIWFGLQLLNGVGADPNGGGVAYWAHAGGFVLGLLFTLPVWTRRGGTAFWNRTRGAPEHPETRYRLQRTHVPSAGRRRR